MKILNCGENHREYRVQVDTGTACILLRIRKTHPARMTDAQFRVWLLQQIADALVHYTAPYQAAPVLASLVGQTVVLPPAQTGGALS